MEVNNSQDLEFATITGLFLPAVVRPILDSFESSKQVPQPALSDVSELCFSNYAQPNFPFFHLVVYLFILFCHQDLLILLFQKVIMFITDVFT